VLHVLTQDVRNMNIRLFVYTSLGKPVEDKRSGRTCGETGMARLTSFKLDGLFATKVVCGNSPLPIIVALMG